MKTWDQSTQARERARKKLKNEAKPCWICNAPIDYHLKSPDPMSFELDHKKPVLRYPELAFEPSNWGASHRRCNRAKSFNEYAPIIKNSGSIL